MEHIRSRMMLQQNATSAALAPSLLSASGGAYHSGAYRSKGAGSAAYVASLTPHDRAHFEGL